LSIFVGGSEVTEIKIGSTVINEVYVGSTLVWSAATEYALTQGQETNAANYGFRWGGYGSISPTSFDGAQIQTLIAYQTFTMGVGFRYFFLLQLYGTNGANLGQNFIKSIAEPSLPNGKLLPADATYQQAYNYPFGANGTSYLVSEWKWELTALPSNWDGSGVLTVEIA
jgi:hypothetical protein